ncbi:hypothetical protein IA539_05610 [Gordonia sp. zg691]|uniref:hypothetical protein n=1 Tax=Gordonia jinghuaiqii TaxID=2758710 RepID=UPI00166225BF|nr:hypothetical protein [Gordonia jinghuaiqii]MBD0860683.1 hypothetical protein [Gordonia jinghuaiqii]
MVLLRDFAQAVIGFTWEHPLHHYFRRAKTDQLLFQDIHVHTGTVADAMIGRCAGEPVDGRWRRSADTRCHGVRIVRQALVRAR